MGGMICAAAPPFPHFDLRNSFTYRSQRVCVHNVSRIPDPQKHDIAVARVEIARRLATAIWHMLTPPRPPVRSARPYAKPLAA